MAEKMVRLVMRMPGDMTDEQAVQLFVENIVATGLRSWAYRVEDMATGEVFGHYDGYGQPLKSLDLGEEEPADLQINTDDSTETQPADPADTAAESDEDLIALGQQLNESETV